MKKIGLVTLYEVDNYGTCLQAFALSHIVNMMGYESEIIRFDRNLSIPKEPLHRKVVSVGIANAINIALCRSAIKVRKEKFNKFRKDYFKYSDYLYSCVEEVKNANIEYDAYITGSDMVWSWELKDFLDYYFLRFADCHKRISYAPSFGNTKFNKEMNNYYKEALAGMRYCSCREERGVEFVKNEVGKDCILASDPTLLITKEVWNELFSLKCNNEKNILFYMFGDIPSWYIRNIKKYEQEGYVIRFVPQNYFQYRYEKKMGNDAFGPIEFIQAFNNASFVITNTYHGLMFSLIYRKPFVMIHRDKNEHWATHEERMQSVLELLGLEDRYLDLDNKISHVLMHLNYGSIETKLNGLIKSSKEYLLTALLNSTREV